MISDILSDAIIAIEEYEKTSVIDYTPFRPEIERCKRAMWRLLRMLDANPDPDRREPHRNN